MTHYQFHNAKTDQIVLIGVSFCMGAALFGAFYVLFKAGLSQFARALFWQIVCIGVLVVIPIGVVYLPQNLHIVVFVIALPAIFVFQSTMMVALVERSFRARGWGVRRED